MLKVLLALLVGLARRRPIVERERSRARLRGATALMADRIQLVPVLAAGVILLIVLELVRRRAADGALRVAVAAAGVVLLGLAAWRGGLSFIAMRSGSYYPPNALFFVAFAFILLLLLHFSSAVSRLSDQTKVLAQRAALLEERLRRLETEGASETANASMSTTGSVITNSGTNPRWLQPDAPVGATTERSAKRQRLRLTEAETARRNQDQGVPSAALTTSRARRCHASREGIASILTATARSSLGGAGDPAHVRCRLKLIEVEHRLRLHEHRRGSGCERFVGHNRVRVQHEPGVR